MINVKANLEVLTGDQKFLKWADGDSRRIRLAPEDKNEMFFYRVFNRYNLKDQDGNSRAVADLSVHGTEETGREDYLARLYEVLKSGTEIEQKIADKIRGNNQYYLLGWELIPTKEKGVFNYSKLKLMSFSEKWCTDLNNLASRMQREEGVDFADPDGGQALIITRTGTAFKTKYTFERTGMVISLDDAVPNWRNTLASSDRDAADVFEEIGLNIYPPDVQKQLAQITFTELDWDRLEEEYGL